MKASASFIAMKSKTPCNFSAFLSPLNPNLAMGPPKILVPWKFSAMSAISLTEAGVPLRYFPGTMAPPITISNSIY